jgi:hypothetical protein
MVAAMESAFDDLARILKTPPTSLRERCAFALQL